MNMLINIAIVGLIIAQFTPKGKEFLSSGKGAAATVLVSALAIFSMLPSILMGNIVSLAFCGIWGYIAYLRLPAATSYAKGAVAYAKRALRLTRR